MFCNAVYSQTTQHLMKDVMGGWFPTTNTFYHIVSSLMPTMFVSLSFILESLSNEDGNKNENATTQ